MEVTTAGLPVIGLAQRRVAFNRDCSGRLSSMSMWRPQDIGRESCVWEEQEATVLRAPCVRGVLATLGGRAERSTYRHRRHRRYTTVSAISEIGDSDISYRYRYDSHRIPVSSISYIGTIDMVKLIARMSVICIGRINIGVSSQHRAPKLFY